MPYRSENEEPATTWGDAVAFILFAAGVIGFFAVALYLSEAKPKEERPWRPVDRPNPRMHYNV